MHEALKPVAAAALAGAALSAFMPSELTTAAAALHQAAFDGRPSLTVRVVYPANSAGEVWVGLFDGQSGFDARNAWVSHTLAADADELVAVFENVPDGEYGVIAFHDSNADGELNFGFMGIPEERYGFSNNPRPRFRPANWSEARFEVSETGAREITIELMGAF